MHLRPCIAVALLLAGCAQEEAADDSAGPEAQQASPVAVAPWRETEPTLEDDPNDVAFWLDPGDVARSLVLGSAGTAGLELFDLDGRRVGRYADAQVDLLAVTYGFELGGATGPLVVAYDRKSGSLVALTIDPASRAVRRVSPGVLDTNGEATGLCAYRSPLTGRHYVFAAVEGSVQQWALAAQGDGVAGHLVRTVPVGSGAGYCAVDAQTHALYVTEEAIGIWRIDAEPETDPQRAPVDLVEPLGHIDEEVKGIAVYRADGETAYLIAADVGRERFNVYAAADGQYLGSFTIGASEAVDAVGEVEGIAATPLGSTAGGLLAVQDEVNDGAGNIKLVPWTDIAQALRLAVAKDVDPRQPPPPTARVALPSVETDPVDNYGDAADDAAVWVNPADPARSLVIGTNKKLGLDVYDLAGRRVQQLADGRMNNVDLRPGFALGGRDVALVTASNRTTKSLAIYALDPQTGRLADAAAGPTPTGLSDPYGLCMYRSARSGEYYALVNDSADGTVRQWRLVPDGDRVRAEPVRDFKVGTQAEGCVADDANGALYIAEEDTGLWRYAAEPDGGDARTLVDSTSGEGRLTADVEGVGLYVGPGDSGYIVVSSQGSDDFALYRREGKNEYVGHVTVISNDELGIDGVSETDGLEVSSAALGPAFPHGILVAQDGRNITPPQRQNFKYVPWERIEPR